MKESIKLEHFNEYRKLSIYNLIVEIDGVLDLEQSTINKIVLSDIKDTTCEISFLNYVQQKIDIARIVLIIKKQKTKINQLNRPPFHK